MRDTRVIVQLALRAVCFGYIIPHYTPLYICVLAYTYAYARDVSIMLTVPQDPPSARRGARRRAYLRCSRQWNWMPDGTLIGLASRATRQTLKSCRRARGLATAGISHDAAGRLMLAGDWEFGSGADSQRNLVAPHGRRPLALARGVSWRHGSVCSGADLSRRR